VLGREVREEQANRDRLDARLADLGHQALQLVLAQILDDPVRAGPLGGAEPALGPDQGRGLGRAEVIEPRPVLTRDLEQVLKAPRRDQRRRRPLLREEGVGPDGHPVGERLDLIGACARPLERRFDRREDAL
jgi:hypothetical protein